MQFADSQVRENNEIHVCALKPDSSLLLETVAKLCNRKIWICWNAQNYIKKNKKIVAIVKDHREDADTKILELLTSANKTAENMGAKINIPRIFGQ